MELPRKDGYKTKLLIIFTGGTIGSAPGADGLAPDGAAARLLLQLFAARRPTPLADSVEWTVCEPLSTLSENITPEHWNRLLDALQPILSERRPAYEGILITHGTDTLAYTAALLDQWLTDVPLPVVLVSSQLPLQNPAADGVDNLAAAVDFIADTHAPGVFAACRGEDGGSVIHRGISLRQCDTATDQFVSFGPPLGTIVEHRFRPTCDLWLSAAPPLSVPRGRLLPCVLPLSPVPGFDYRCVELTQDVRAVLHGVYHSGTACAGDGEHSPYSLLYLQKRCREREIPVFLAPVRREDYATSHELRRAGIYPLYGLSYEAAYTRLLIAFSCCVNAADALGRLGLPAQNDIERAGN